MRVRTAVVLLLSLVAAGSLRAQTNYEIQVYGSETVPAGRTMVELHSNFTIRGTKETVEGVRPTEHQWHETVEITHGWTDWAETGFYQFTSAQPGYGWSWVGTHIRPRVRVPEAWGWPVGVSLSTELGYVRPAYSSDTWTWEIRPIVDKRLGRWYLAFNPSFDRAFHGPSVAKGLEFSPNFKAAYDVTRKVTLGVEYYGSLGPVTGFDPLREQQQQIMPTLDLNLSERWEFNLSAGLGVTAGTDRLLVKMILGYRFNR